MITLGLGIAGSAHYKKCYYGHTLQAMGIVGLLSFPCSSVGSPLCSLFLHYDIDARLDATMTVLGLDAAIAPYYGKALFWVRAASYGNNCITCSFCVVLLGRLHGLSSCTMTLMRTWTPL